MDSIQEKIGQILDETKKIVAERDFEKAVKYLEAILLFDPDHEEAIYVLTRIKERLNTPKNVKPNVFIEDELWGASTTTYYIINGVEVAKITDIGNMNIKVPIGKHDLVIKTKHTEIHKVINIPNEETTVLIRTFYKGMGVVFSAEVVIKENNTNL
jgi:hypothetical protein